MNTTVVIRPPETIPIDRPVIFVAGPILGSNDWQRLVIEQLLKSTKPFIIASPRRLIAEVDEMRKGEFTEADFNEQMFWEHRHLDFAAKNGVTLFWLAKKTHNIPNHSYAQTSRFELGEAMVRYQLQNSKLVVGIESGFEGEHYIRETFAGKAPRVPLCNSIEETCAEALRLI